MYLIYIDNGDGAGNRIIYYPGDAEFAVENAVVKLAIGQAGSCEFKVPPFNPLYGSIFNRKSMITVYRDNKEVFCGEVRESGKDHNNFKKVYAVGELAFLSDTIQLPHRYTGAYASPSSFLGSVITNHNGQVQNDTRKQFTKGYTTFSPDTDADDKVTDYDYTLPAIRSNLTEKLGGCLRVRKSGGTKYLDYIDISAYGNTNTQGINFGENLLDYAEDLSASDIATVVIPLGARLDEAGDGFEKRVDIKTVNSGNNYLTAGQSILDNFGYVWRTVTFDGITDPQELKTAGQKWLTANQYETMTIKVTAVDLSQMDSSIDSMELGDLVPCVAEPYGMNTSMYIQEMTLNLMNPQKDTITMSATYQNKKSGGISSRVSSGESKIRQEAAERELKIRNVIRQEMANIMAKFAGAQGGYKLVEFDEQTGLWLKDLYMNAPSKAQATRILEISMNGIRMYNGAAGQYTDPTKWKTAWDFDGGFCADFILTGTLLAGLIKAGILSDAGGNFSLNLETGAISAKNMSIDSTNFDLDTAGNMTATSATLNNAAINGGHIVSSSSEETLDIEQALIKGKRGSTDIGYIDLSADTGDQQQTEYNAVFGSNNTLRLEFYNEIQLVDRRSNQIIGFIDGYGYHGPIDDTWLPEPTIIYVNNGSGGNSGDNNGGGEE